MSNGFANGKVIALVAVLEYGEFFEMLRVADVLASRCGVLPIIAFVRHSYRRLATDTTVVVSRGYSWMDAAGVVHDTAACDAAYETGHQVSSHEIIRPSVQRAENKSDAAPEFRDSSRPIRQEPVHGSASILKDLLVDVLNALADIRSAIRRHRMADLMLVTSNPALVVVGQDPLGTELTALLKASRRRGVPTLIVPFAMFNAQEWAEFAIGRQSLRVAGRPLNRVAAWLWPRWVFQFRGQSLLRFVGSRAIALELTKSVEGHPWRPLTTPVDAIACESEISIRALRGAGVSEVRLKAVGLPVHDRLAKLVAEHNAGNTDKERTSRQLRLVCGWPVNMFAWLGGRRIAFPDYPAVARAWSDALAGVRDDFNVEVAISVHPKTLDDELTEPLSMGLPIVRGETEALVARCDLFTTLNGSSITAWALACGKPVVLFDCFQTGYPEFQDVPGCLLEREQSGFVASLRRLASDSDERHRLASELARVAPYWGLLDGNSEQRLASLAFDLMERR